MLEKKSPSALKEKWSICGAEEKKVKQIKETKDEQSAK